MGDIWHFQYCSETGSCQILCECIAYALVVQVLCKFNPMEHVLKGKTVIVIDDSIVRGTTAKQLVRLEDPEILIPATFLDKKPLMRVSYAHTFDAHKCADERHRRQWRMQMRQRECVLHALRVYSCQST